MSDCRKTTPPDCSLRPGLGIGLRIRSGPGSRFKCSCQGLGLGVGDGVRVRGGFRVGFTDLGDELRLDDAPLRVAPLEPGVRELDRARGQRRLVRARARARARFRARLRASTPLQLGFSLSSAVYPPPDTARNLRRPTAGRRWQQQLLLAPASLLPPSCCAAPALPSGLLAPAPRVCQG